MFARLAVASVLALPLLAAAAHCNTGPVQCCDRVESADSAAAAGLISALGIAIKDVTAKVGLDCSPISVVGAGANTCAGQPVCCENNSWGSLISVGCAPVQL
ncbi:fungal hydrophobin-domain-containing protein [Trametes meyenii]|nr:fungal hydrophobin-domain-containing protein [Trametes meyenii]